MAVQIRDATPDDEASCAALLTELRGGGDPDPRLTDVFGMLLSKERGQITVAVEDGTVLGMATVSFNLALRYGGEYCQLEELIVSPRARGRNLGGRLVQTVVEIASTRGCAEIGLYLLESTEHNRPFYAKIRIRGRWQRDAPASEYLGASPSGDAIEADRKRSDATHSPIGVTNATQVQTSGALKRSRRCAGVLARILAPLHTRQCQDIEPARVLVSARTSPA